MRFNSSSSYLPFVQISRIVAQVGLGASSFFSFIFIFMTLFVVERRFGSYTYLLLSFATNGIMFASIEFLIYPNVHSYNVGYFFYSTSRPFGLQKDVVEWLLASYTGVYASTVSMQSVQSIYRYWAVFYRHKLRMFKGCWLLLWMVYCLAFGAQWALGIYFLDESDDYSKGYMRDALEKNYGMNIDEVAGFAVVAYGADGSPRFKNMLGFLNMTSIMVTQYVIIVFCTVRMYQNMEDKILILSPSMRTLHRQFYRTLILQISLPFIFLFTPVILIINLPLLDVELDLPTGSALCSMSLYPAIDSLIIMFIVSDYRIAAKNMFKKILNCSNPTLGQNNSAATQR